MVSPTDVSGGMTDARRLSAESAILWCCNRGKSRYSVRTRRHSPIACFNSSPFPLKPQVSEQLHIKAETCYNDV